MSSLADEVPPWRIEIHVPMEVCIDLFERTLNGSAPHGISDAGWSIQRYSRSDGMPALIATYLGAESRDSQRTIGDIEMERVSIGSQLSLEFDVIDTERNLLVCNLWLSAASMIGGAVANKEMFDRSITNIVDAFRSVDVTIEVTRRGNAQQ